MQTNEAGRMAANDEAHRFTPGLQGIGQLNTPTRADTTPLKPAPNQTLLEQQASRLRVDQMVSFAFALITGLALWYSGELANLLSTAQAYSQYRAAEILLLSIPIALAALLFAYLRGREHSALIQHIHQTQYLDPLTGITNRSGMERLLCEELQRSQRYENKLCILLLDIDHFRNINDLYGHRIGDRVIQHIAMLLKKSIRGPDKVGRLDGEEFILMLPETSLDQAEVVAERIRNTILEQPLMDDGEAVIVSVSIGVAEGGGDPADKLFYHADQALSQAKKNGRNQVRTWCTH